MGLDMVRAGGGRVPLVLALLSLLSVSLIFNWWSLSTENLDLLRQIENLSEHLKSSSSLLDHCRHDRTSFEGRVQTLEEHTDQLVKSLTAEKQKNSNLEESVKKQASDLSETEKKFSDASDSLNMCRAELDSLKKVDVSKDGVIASMRIEKGELTNQIQDLKEQMTKLQNEIDQAKSAPAVPPVPQPAVNQIKSPTVASSSKLENAVPLEEEPRNIPAPNHADPKDGDRDDKVDKDETLLTDDADDREKEMQEAP